MNLFLLIEIMSGYYLSIRISKKLLQQHLFSKKQMTNFGTGYFFYLLLFLFVSPKSHVLVTFLIFTPLVLLELSISFLKKWRNLSFQKDFLRFINNTQIKMRLGYGFKSAVYEAQRYESFYFQKIISRIFESMAFSPQVCSKSENKFLNFISLEFQSIESQPHNAISRLENLRNTIRNQENIRRKSGQVKLQVQIQIAILSGFYFALLLYVIFQDQWRSNMTLILVSLLLFVTGIFTTFHVGKRITWKI
ncbi:MAG: hypothetical protein KDD61_10925 [Bdellovibrionales bacterium]|nr:hypothetical protein [Bdellovibrionales bacterium]